MAMFRALRAALLAAALAGAEEDVEGTGPMPLTPEQLHAMHSKLDINKDGKASIAEFVQFSTEVRKLIAHNDLKMIFSMMDKDKDGRLSISDIHGDMDQWGKDEDSEANKEWERQKFRAADANSDGFLNMTELVFLYYPEFHDGVSDIMSKSTMDQKDINSDGLLTMEEFWSGGGDTQVVPISDAEKDEFARLDRDKSGGLDLQELKHFESGRFHTEEALQKILEHADRDGDLHVTAEELTAARRHLAGTEAHHHLLEWAAHGEL